MTDKFFSLHSALKHAHLWNERLLGLDLIATEKSEEHLPKNGHDLGFGHVATKGMFIFAGPFQQTKTAYDYDLQGHG